MNKDNVWNRLQITNQILKGLIAICFSLLTSFAVFASTTTTVDLIWDSVDLADSYQLERKSADGEFSFIYQGQDTSFSDEITAGELYSYRVIACLDVPNDGIVCSDEIADYSNSLEVSAKIYAVEYIYDALGRVYQVKKNGNLVIQYDHDAAGNRKTVTYQGEQ